MKFNKSLAIMAATAVLALSAHAYAADQSRLSGAYAQTPTARLVARAANKKIRVGGAYIRTSTRRMNPRDPAYIKVNTRRVKSRR